jgi:hypothetical protein
MFHRQFPIAYTSFYSKASHNESVKSALLQPPQTVAGIVFDNSCAQSHIEVSSYVR